MMLSRVSGNSNLSGLDEVLLTVVLLFSVNPFFTAYRWVKLLLLLIVFLRFGYKRKFHFLFDYRILVVFLILGVLALIQGVIWEFSGFSLITVFALEFLTPYYLYRIFREHFFEVLERAIYRLTMISVAFWLLHEVFQPLRSVLIAIVDFLHAYSSDSVVEGGIRRSMILYTFMYEYTMMPFGIYRNSGFCHEPGGFAVFANLGLFISLISGRRMLVSRNMIYVVAIISTFSTAGILSLFFIVLSRVLIIQRSDLILLLIIAFIPPVIYLYNNTSFLGGKISDQFYSQVDLSLESATTGRLFGARKSLNVLVNHPISGRGLLSVSRPVSTTDPEFAAYGWLSEVARFGLIVGIIGIFLFVKGFRVCVRDYTDSWPVLFLGGLSLLVSLSSQVYLTNPIFFSFVFIGLYRKNFQRQII